jgi:hypothetical protein
MKNKRTSAKKMSALKVANKYFVDSCPLLSLQGKKMDYQTHNIIIYCDGTLCNNN